MRVMNLRLKPKLITGVTQAAEETGAAANQTAGAAGQLSQQSEVLKQEVGKFLAQARAA
ncbi:MAG: hypothetical protein V3R66_05495 [Rhodospirillales bacterium]